MVLGQRPWFGQSGLSEVMGHLFGVFYLSSGIALVSFLAIIIAKRPPPRHWERGGGGRAMVVKKAVCGCVCMLR